MASLRRIKKEWDNLNKLQNDKSKELDYGCSPEVDDIRSWQGHLTGPKGSPYEDGVFFLDIKFPTEYPFKPPKIKFQTKIYHMNINDQGDLCLPILKEDWSPAFSIMKVCEQLLDLLKNPNVHDPLVTEIALQYSDKREEHDKKAESWTKKYAQ